MALGIEPQDHGEYDQDSQGCLHSPKPLGHSKSAWGTVETWPFKVDSYDHLGNNCFAAQVGMGA